MCRESCPAHSKPVRIPPGPLCGPRSRSPPRHSWPRKRRESPSRSQPGQLSEVATTPGAPKAKRVDSQLEQSQWEIVRANGSQPTCTSLFGPKASLARFCFGPKASLPTCTLGKALTTLHSTWASVTALELWMIRTCRCVKKLLTEPSLLPSCSQGCPKIRSGCTAGCGIIGLDRFHSN